MIITSVSVALFIGYSFGWVKGYEVKEQDDKRIEGELNEFWKEIKSKGVR